MIQKLHIQIQKEEIMAGDPIPFEFRVQQCYTLEEAVQVMKIYDRNPIQRQPLWKSCRTGKPVSIGYT